MSLLSPDAEDAERLKSVLILGGWSPGPLLFLKNTFRGYCRFHEPKIPMPPVGCSWCVDPSMAALILTIAAPFTASSFVGSMVESRATQVFARLSIFLAMLVAIRYCIAGVVRGSVAKGVAIAQRTIQEQGVNVVIGFSWGGAVVAHMLQRGYVGGEGLPSVIMIAPTTALVATIAMEDDPALLVRVTEEMRSRIHVFHATDDGAFCPHSHRWDQTGVTFHMCRDNHVFCRRESVQELGGVLMSLLDDSLARSR